MKSRKAAANRIIRAGKIIELKDEKHTENIVDYQLNWYIKWLFDYIIPNYNGKPITISPCIIAAKTTDEKIIKHIAEKEFNNPYSYTFIDSTEYYAFDISEERICFERVL